MSTMSHTDAAVCALAKGLRGRLLTPDTADYAWASKPFIARFDDLRPTAVVRPADAADVSRAVLFARAHDLPFAVRSGGHSFAGFSSTDGLLIDVSVMDEVLYADGVAHVGAGTRIGDLGGQLADVDQVVPAGSCPSVGIAGTALGGGLGVLGRLYGLTLDHILSAEVVLADGSQVRADEDHEPDLFWALRGAGGGNFGVVTSFRFRTHTAPRMTNFYLTWPMARAAEVFLGWQRWAPAAPEELAAGFGLTGSDDPTEEPVVEVFGAMAADEPATRETLREYVDLVGSPATSRVAALTYRETAHFQAGLLDPVNNLPLQMPSGQVGRRQGHRFTKSEFFDREISLTAVEELMRVVAEERVPGAWAGLEAAPWLAGYAAVAPDATAFRHRGATFSLKHAIMLPPGSSAERLAEGHRWVNAAYQAVHPYGSGAVYPNFPDPELADWPHAYYGANLDRLRQVKAAYDPDDAFRFAQSIPLPPGRSA